jgi:hypothetical protein
VDHPVNARDAYGLTPGMVRRDLEQLGDDEPQVQLSGEVKADITGRCQSAHPEDPSPCVGPLDAVTVLDPGNRGAKGCEWHAARLLASLKGGRVYSGSVPEAAIRVFKAAAELAPFAWVERGRS